MRRLTKQEDEFLRAVRQSDDYIRKYNEAMVGLTALEKRIRSDPQLSKEFDDLVERAQKREAIEHEKTYEEYLEGEIDSITGVLEQLLLDHWEGKSIDPYVPEIEEWLGDDWHVDLSDEDLKRVYEIKGWIDG